MEKNEREKKMLYEWGIENEQKYHFSAIDDEKESYFIERCEGKNPYIREFGYEILPELMQELEILWGKDDVMGKMKRVVGVSALKNKPLKAAYTEGEERKEQGGKNKLPTFIYNF